MTESVLSSPNSAQGNAIGMPGLHSMDALMNEQAIPFDYSPYNYMANDFDMVAKTYPFQMNQFPPTSFPQYHYEQIPSLEDVQKFQAQLYQVLRYQEVRNDLIDEESFLYSFQDVDSTSGASTIDTPLPNTSILSIPESVITPDFPIPLPDPEIQKKSIIMDRTITNSPLPNPEAAPKKYTRKHVMARSKKGCWICRIKHLKCDERKPVCHNCVRFDIKCDYSPERPDYVTDRELRRRKLDSITTKKRRNSAMPKSIRR